MRLLLGDFKSSLELVNTSAGINKLLLTGKEGVTLGANFNSHFAALCGLCCDCFSASASDYALFILRMDVLFHFFHLTKFLHCSLTVISQVDLLYHFF